MATIAKVENSSSNNNNKSNNVKKNVSIDTIQAEYESTKSQIRKILGKTKDKSDLKDEDKNSLRSLYLKAAQYAKTLSERVTDEKEQVTYKDEWKFLTERAAGYGSTINNTIPSTTFDDVKGLESVKKIVKSFMFMLQHDDIIKHYKMESGFGMLMYGAPGTGKTMFAEALANAMNLPLFIVTPADIFKSYVGESEQAVKRIFEEIDACDDGAILFVDECESIFSKRTNDTKDYKAAVTTELLQRINGFGVNGSKRVLVAATNRPDVIDPAYLRYKRFSHLVHVTPPDKEAATAIIYGKVSQEMLEPGFNVSEIPNMIIKDKVVDGITIPYEKGDRYSAADLCGIVEEACRFAIEKIQEMGLNHPIPLTREMFQNAIAKIPPSITVETLELYNNFRKNID